MADTLLTNCNIITETGILQNGYLLMKDGLIAQIGDAASLPPVLHDTDIIPLSQTLTIVPGFIDVHIHGVAGADTMDATIEALETMASTLPREGTTSFLATTITQSEHSILQALSNVSDFITHHNLPGKAEILGSHLEGPFINPLQKGAQPKMHIVPPDIERFSRFQAASGNSIKLVTLAPEMKNGLTFIQYLKENKVVASIGHSNASYHQVEEAILQGATHVTHLFNGMRGMHHRDPGVVGAALLANNLTLELIADGIHVVPEMIKLTVKAKGLDGIILVTDSMRGKHLTPGSYDLGGQIVTVDGKKAMLRDGSLAGSVLRMNDSLKNMMEFTGISLLEAVKLASENPAKQLNIYHRKGSIAPGKDADLVVLDQNLDVQLTFCRGNRAFDRLID